MKTIIAILFLAIAFTACDKECPDQMKYEALKKELINIREEIATKKSELEVLRLSGMSWKDYLIYYDELVDLQIMEAVIEIDIENTLRDSKCIN